MWRNRRRAVALALLLLAAVLAFILSPRPSAANGAANESGVSSRHGKRPRRSQSQTPTFSREVVRIFQQNCQSCHHPGDIAPFSLVTYQQARPWARAIREQVILRKMPPWKPAGGCRELGEERGLTDDERATIVAWVDGGSPEGDPADLPPPLVFPDGWSFGEPDLVLGMPDSYTPPVGNDIYRCFSLPVEMRSDRYVSAVEVHPGNRRIVHHVIGFLDPEGESAALDAADPGPGYTCFGGPGFSTSGIVTAWAPGARASEEPEGVGIRLEQRSRVVLQIHYHPGFAPESDRTQIGLRFARAPVKKDLIFIPLEDRGFVIPAGASRYEVSESIVSPFNAHLVSIAPHMHLLGREISVEMTKLFGTPECLIRINDWDFNWQSFYHFRQQVAVPFGTEVRLRAVYDNSAGNSRNPNSPPRDVSYGEATTDEMALAILGFTLDLQDLPVSSPLITGISAGEDGALVVSGQDLREGAEIEIAGRIVRDTRNQAGALASAEMWKVLAAPGQMVDVRVLNPDGARSSAVSFRRAGVALPLSTVSAASFAPKPVAPESIVSAFGAALANSTTGAGELPLPVELSGTRVRVNGVLAPLFFVSPGQVNFLIPTETGVGPAVVEITAGDGTLSRGEVMLAASSPALFTANSSGSGAPAALVTVDGVTFSPAGNVDGTPNEIRSGDFLVLFGTGVRRATAAAVKITIGGADASVLFAGAQGSFVGLDQINTQIPPGVSGLVDLVLTVNGEAANTVRVKIR